MATAATASSLPLHAAPPVAPAASPRYTLLRVKRKRDESPLSSLILSGETQTQHKRSAVDDLRLRLEKASIHQREEESETAQTAAQAGQQEEQEEGKAVVVRRVFQLVGTVQNAGETVDDALLSRIAALQSQRRASALHPSIPQSSSLSEQTERHVEQAQQRASTAREQRLQQARAAAAASASSARPAVELPAESLPFTFLDVEISRPLPLSSSSAASDAATALHHQQAHAQSSLRAVGLEQQHKDRIFSQAMSIVKAMPDRERMSAYESLLDDYWSLTAGGAAAAGEKSFVQQVHDAAEQQGLPQSLRRPQRLQRIDVLPALARPQQAMQQDEEAADSFVYDVYHVLEGEQEAEQAEAVQVDGAAAVGRVVIDSKVAGWFGLVLDDDEQQPDSDEDDEDENRESAPGNDYGDEEDGDEEDDDSDAEGGRRMEGDVAVGGYEDEEEAFHRLRAELQRSGNELIAQSDADNDDDGDYWDEDDEDEYDAAHRSY